jgi:Uma2 family endonuclease
MNIQSKHPTTADEFLRWNEGREGKWDFVDGKIVDMMVRISRNHALLASNLIVAFRRKLAFPPYTVSTADFGVKTLTSVRYPDLMVDGEAGGATDLAAAAPLLIAEVLSPSTMAVDFGPKADEYRTIETLRHYLVFAQDEPRVWHWSRGAHNDWAGPEMVVGFDQIVPLPDFGLTLHLDSLYSGLAGLRHP